MLVKVLTTAPNPANWPKKRKELDRIKVKPQLLIHGLRNQFAITMPRKDQDLGVVMLLEK
jgi:hypothetical protein